MKLSRQHFAFIAETIKELPVHNASLRAQKESLASSFAEKLKHTNMNFNKSRFLDSCGVGYMNDWE